MSFRHFFPMFLFASKGEVKPFHYDLWGDYSVLPQYPWKIGSRTPPFLLLPGIPKSADAQVLYVQRCRRIGPPYLVKNLQTRRVAHTLAKELEKHRDYIYYQLERTKSQKQSCFQIW